MRFLRKEYPSIEEWLIDTATFHPLEPTANRCMKILRYRYSKEYHFCWEYDGLATKPMSGCSCLNRNKKNYEW